jgi:sulfofructose kinase
VTGVGVNSFDLVFRIPIDIQAFHSAGKVQALDARSFCGGQTATALAACGAFGLTTRYIGAFGAGESASRMRAELEQRGIDLTHAVERDVPNAGAGIVVDKAGHRTVMWNRDPRLGLMPGDIPAAVLAASRLIHVDDVDQPAALHAARVGRDRAILVTSDLEQAVEGTEELVSTVTYPIFDPNAPAVLTGERDPERALRKLRRLNAGVLCMTLGEHGAAALEGDRFHLAPAVTVAVVDTTGAGDVFRAGFIYGLLQGWPVERLLGFANAAAALSCTRLGAIASVPSLNDINQLLSSSQS